MAKLGTFGYFLYGQLVVFSVLFGSHFGPFWATLSGAFCLGLQQEKKNIFKDQWLFQ
jgi:hypothetical protein